MIQYENTWLSITAYIKQQMDMIVANGICTKPEIEMIDWEDHANMEELPAVHLVGPASMALEEESQNIYRVTFTVALGSYDDKGLRKHRKMIDLLAKSFASGSRVTLFEAADERPYGWLKIVDGTTVAPLAKTNSRAFQTIQVEGLVDPMA